MDDAQLDAIQERWNPGRWLPHPEKEVAISDVAALVAEVRRLRGVVRVVDGQRGDNLDRCDELEAEVRRLRAAWRDPKVTAALDAHGIEVLGNGIVVT